MESLAVDHKPTLDLVPMVVSLLLKHCNDNEQQLQEIDNKLTMVGMKVKLKKYKSKLVQEPAIIADVPELADPQADRPGGAKAHHRSRPQFATTSLFDRGELSPEHWQEAVGNSLFVAMFES
jgi:hypothetical protein